MSTILGVWQYNEAAAMVASSLEKMCSVISPGSHKPYVSKTHSDVGFAYAHTLNTPESAYEKLPLYLSSEDLLFVSQARIDNRPALAAQLGIRLTNECTDADIILQSYLFWGKDCVNHLSGSWSFAVFDNRKKELFIARDPMGYTSLYYYQDDSGFYFGSSIKSILAIIDSNKKQLNELHLVRNLTLWDHSLDQRDTYFKNIYSLSPAHLLTIKNKRSTLQKYWSPENIPFRYYRKKQTYSDEMFALFNNGVNMCLRSHKPIASMLSGGLDSSTVSYVAAELLKSKNITLTTLSHVPYFTQNLLQDKEKEDMILDETPFINEVVRASNNIHPLFINSGNTSIIKSMLEGLDIYSGPVHGASNLYWLLDIYRTTAQNGFGTLLTGEGGNGSISFKGVPYLLSPFKLKRFFLHPRASLKLQVINPVLNILFNRQNNRGKSATRDLGEYVKSIFIKQPLIDKYDIIRDIEKNNKNFNTPIKNINEMKRKFIEIYDTRSQFGAACNHYFGIELRDPCTNKELMEYFFSIPNEVFFDEHYNHRMVVKRMMKGKIPDSVLFAKKGGLQSADIVYRAKAQQQEITAAIEAVKCSAAANHYIDINKLHQTWQSYLTHAYVEPYQMQRILKPLQFALFLQKHFD